MGFTGACEYVLSNKQLILRTIGKKTGGLENEMKL